MRHRITPAIFALFLAGAAAPDAPLEWKWKEGDSFWVEYSTEFSDKSNISGQDLKQNEKINAVFQVGVQKASADGPTLSVKVHQFKFSNPDAQPLADKLQGSTFEVGLDAQLAVVRMSGLEKVVLALEGGETLSKGERKMITGILEAMNGYWLSELLIAMPGKPTKPGDRWEQKSVISLPPIGQLVMSRSLKDDGAVQEGGKDLRKISLDVKFAVEPYKGELDAPVKIEKIEVKKSDCTTTAFFDPAAGRLVKSESRQKYSMHLTMQLEGKNQEADQERDQTHRIRVLAESPLK